MTPSEIVKDVRSEFDATPCLINAGQCEIFAREVVEKLNTEMQDTAVVQSTHDVINTSKKPDSMDQYPIHYFIKYNGTYYDSECPNGVTNILNLPFFRRIEESINEDHLI